jgi:hypothetical protein
MSGICFYQEFRDQSKHRSVGTIIAALVCNGLYWSSGSVCYEAIAGVFDQPNSPVAGTGVACDYLRRKCKRISEAKARTIHPALFERLDQPQYEHETEPCGR